MIVVAVANFFRGGLGGFRAKWRTAYFFCRYSGARVTPLTKVLKDIPGADARAAAANMGWLTWSDVFKTVLRATIAAGQERDCFGFS
jgi:hypothetical protein